MKTKTTFTQTGAIRVHGCCDAGIAPTPQPDLNFKPTGPIPDTWNTDRPTLEQQLAQIAANQMAILKAFQKLADQQADEAEEKAARRRAQKSLTGMDAGIPGALPHGFIAASVTPGFLWTTMYGGGTGH